MHHLGVEHKTDGKEVKGHLSGEVSVSLKLLEERWQKEGCEEEDNGPKQNIWDVGSMVTTSWPHKIPMEQFTHLKNNKTTQICEVLL